MKLSSYTLATVLTQVSAVICKNCSIKPCPSECAEAQQIEEILGNACPKEGA